MEKIPLLDGVIEDPRGFDFVQVGRKRGPVSREVERKRFGSLLLLVIGALVNGRETHAGDDDGIFGRG